MNRYFIRVISIISVVLFICSGVVYAKSLDEIFAGKSPSVDLTTNQLADLINHTKGQFKDINGSEWFAPSIAKLYGSDFEN